MYTYVCVYLCACMCVYMHISVHVCMHMRILLTPNFDQRCSTFSHYASCLLSTYLRVCRCVRVHLSKSLCMRMSKPEQSVVSVPAAQSSEPLELARSGSSHKLFLASRQESGPEAVTMPDSDISAYSCIRVSAWKYSLCTCVSIIKRICIYTYVPT